MYLLWNRFKYVLSPQFDIYETVAQVVRGKVADIGFGTGFGTHLLINNADEVHGFEIDEGAIRFASKIFPYKKLHFSYGDITDGINGLFDYIVMIDVIEHIHNDKEALENIRTMGGTLILSTPNRLSRYRKSENHVREYAPRELENLLKGVFSSVDMRNYRLDSRASKYDNPILAVCR
jgi:2-polyprenyl-3-methyl-5-hydroxy-6-metoxy-1,4-benzoquinol methylase